jgi:hypothetical protein
VKANSNLPGVLSLWLLWPVLLPLTVAAAALAAVAVRRHSLRLLSFGATGLLAAMALYGLVEGSSWQSAVIWLVASLPTLLATTLLARICVLQAWKPVNAAVLSLAVGVLVMPAGTIAHLLTTCFFANECV